ncbi:MAG TPA: hypothetical protein VFX79_01760 [Candidatus Saccharimonadales bacterium]|nr:hypothetical protein [Candidatus Saccharimonadales bacterium]
MIEIDRPQGPETSIDRAFSYGMDIWDRVRGGEFEPRRPSTRKLIQGNVARLLDEEERSQENISWIVDGSRYVSESSERTDLLNNFLLEIALEPEVSLGELRDMGYGLDTPNGDETVYAVARFLTKDMPAPSPDL